ncbi:MAG: hypothetical protein L0Z50_31515 [Verrucomicrobiales bacterium]|nr:hypothetical protein [Verrucomicrobiales bacterium]
MPAKYCYWTVVDGEYAEMAKTVIWSARNVGVLEDFHVWTDREVSGAICHEAGKFDKSGCLFKLTYLRNAVQVLNYDYFIWLDSDSYFVRNPGNILKVMGHSPIHIALERDLCCPENRRPNWWDCPNATFAELMRAKGVRSNSIFNVNGGLFIVQHDVIETVFELAFDFWQFANSKGYAFNDEPLLAYAMQMLCGNPYIHTLRKTADLWASDWTGHFEGKLPDGQPWWFVDYFTGEKLAVNPAIVHAMRSKDALIQAATPDRALKK